MVGFVGPVSPDLRLLAGQVPLIFWDQGESGAPGSLAIECAGIPVAAPLLTLSAPLESGGTRVVLAFAMPDGAVEDILVKQSDGTALCSLESGQGGVALLEPATLLASLSDAGRVRVARFLLQTCRTAFSLSADQIYVDNIRRLVDELSLRPDSLEPLCFLDRRFVLAAGRLPAPVGAQAVAVTISSEAVRQTPLPPAIDRLASANGNRQTVMLPLHRSALSEGSRVVVLGATAIAIRAVKTARQSLETAVSWIANQNRVLPQSRNYVLQCLTQLGQTDARACDAAREVLLIEKVGGGSPSRGVRSLLDIDCAIALFDHLFIRGSIADRHGLIGSVDVVVGNWSTRIDRASLHTFAASHDAGIAGSAEPVTGFAVLAGGHCPVPRFGTAKLSLTLTSGASMEVGQAPLLLDGSAARDAILRAVPAAAITESVLERLLSPAIELAQQATEARPPQTVDAIEIGVQRAAATVSLIMPIGSDPGLIKTWSAAMGGGILPDDGFELIVVAPSDGDLAGAERTLATLHRQYGIASRLVPAVAGMGARAFFRAGATAATRETLLLLDRGCLPSDGRSLAMLIASATDAIGSGPVAGAILDPSGAIRHAGFTPPRHGVLGKPYEGFPAPQLDRLPSPSVFACSASYLAVARSDFEAVEGFSDAFLTRDWSDADFCLKARSKGCDVRMEPGSRAICYAARKPESDAIHALSSRLDARRFARDWGSQIACWPEGHGAAVLSGPDRPPSLSRESTGNPRWAA